MTRRAALVALAAGAVSGCAGGVSAGGALAGGVSARGRNAALTGAPHVLAAGPAFNEALVRGAALGAGVGIEDVMLSSTVREAGSASNPPASLIGPLRGGDIARARRDADPQTVLVSLSNDARAATPGVVLVGVTAEESTARILDYAGRRGVARVAVLGDGGDWSLECARAARRFAPTLGLQIVSEDILAQGAPSPETLARLARADAVLIPPGGTPLQRLAGPLAETGVQLLGTHQWAQGAAPVGGWRSGLDPDHVEAFRQLYRGAYGEPASHLAMLAFDAARVARVSAGRDPARWAPVPAASGVLEFDDRGVVWRGLAVLAVAREGETAIEGRARS